MENQIKIPKISGDEKTDAKIYFNYTEAEKAFLTDDEHPMNVGKTIKERVESQETQNFIAWMRKKNLEEQKQVEDLAKERSRQGYVI